MILNPRWLDWLSDEEDEYGNRRKLKPDTPEDIREEYENLVKEEKESIKKTGLKKTIFYFLYRRAKSTSSFYAFYPS